MNGILCNSKVVLILSFALPLFIDLFHAKADVKSANDAKTQLSQIYQKRFLLSQREIDPEVMVQDIQQYIFNGLFLSLSLLEIGEIVLQEANDNIFLFYPPKSGWMASTGDVYLDVEHGGSRSCEQRDAELASISDIVFLQGEKSQKPGFLNLDQDELLTEHHTASHSGRSLCVIRKHNLLKKEFYETVVRRVSSRQDAAEKMEKIIKAPHPALGTVVLYWDRATKEPEFPMGYYSSNDFFIYSPRKASSIVNVLEKSLLSNQ
jgi:hypothetical protein